MMLAKSFFHSQFSKVSLAGIVFFGLFLQAPLANSEEKGLLPEINTSRDNEDENQLKALKTEVMITKAENQAIATLQKILKRKRGSAEEPSLWYRLAELYMKRAKSGRFFDLFRDNDKAVQFVAPAIREQTAANHLKDAIKIYAYIEQKWPDFSELDSVLFNSAFAFQQIGSKENAEKQYSKLLKKYPNSYLHPDTRLALGEMTYQAQRFQEALDHFEAIEKYPDSRVYAYGLYKAAWTLYNMKKNNEAIDRLIRVVKFFDPNIKRTGKVNHNLRKESLSDLALFFGEVNPPELAYTFFSRLCVGEELGEAILNMARLYESHSRFKELNIFVAEYISKNPTAKDRIKIQLIMTDSLETLKDRKSVVVQLEDMAKVCAAGSSFREKNEKKIADESCDFDFAHLNVELAKKWWDLWQRNRNNKEIVGYTLKAFEIHLNREIPTKPDTKSRYAYAELLYQIGDFRAASKQYELVSDHSEDTANRHDSSYSALVALEKAMEKDKQSKDQDELLRLSTKYLKNHKEGTHRYQVQFKVGFIYFEKQNLEESEKWLKPLSLDKGSGEFKRKSEDIVLEIFNRRKDYLNIQNFALELLKGNPADDRKSQLTRLVEEAKYSSIQDFVKTGNQVESSQKLYQFAKDHEKSTLAKDAFWQALSLSFSAGKSIDGADQSIEFIKKYPDDKRNKEIMKEAAKAYAESGYLAEAAQNLEKLSEQVSGKDQLSAVEAAADFYYLDGQSAKARKMFQKLLGFDKDKEYKGRIYSHILDTLKGKENTPEYAKFEEKILEAEVEPYHTQILMKRAEKEYKEKNIAETFKITLIIVRGSGPDEIRAQARLIQAEILEGELFAQSTKTTVEKLAVVLGMKTEKLDKAQTAYLSASKLSQSIDVQIRALSGLSRCYQNYVDSVTNPTLRSEISPEDKKVLESELSNLTRPIAEKRKEIDEKLAQLQLKKSDSMLAKKDEKPSEVRAPAEKPKTIKYASFLPETFYVGKNSSFDRTEFSKRYKCEMKPTDKNDKLNDLYEKANRCILLKNYSLALKYVDFISRSSEKVTPALFYRAVIADEQKESAKAKWLIDLALKKDPEHPILIYQKGLIHFHAGEIEMAQNYFDQAEKLKVPIKSLKSIEEGS